MPLYPDGRKPVESPLHTLIPPADEKRLLYEAPDRVLKSTPMKRVVQAVRLLDALEGIHASKRLVVLTGGVSGWLCTPREGSELAPTPTEAAEKALARARKDDVPRCPACGEINLNGGRCPPCSERGRPSRSCELAPGSIEIKHGEIPAAALGPKDPRCGVCGGPHVFADHFRDGPHRAEELKKRLNGVGEAMVDLSRRALALDADNQKLLDEFHEARQGTVETPDAPFGPSPHWTAEQEAAIKERAERTIKQWRENMDRAFIAEHDLIMQRFREGAGAKTTGLPVEVPAATDRGFPWKCKLCDRQATSVAAGEGPRCDEHAGDTAGDELSFPAGTLRVKHGDPIPRGYFIGTQGREETT